MRPTILRNRLSVIWLIILSVFFIQSGYERDIIKYFSLNGQKVKVTHQVDKKFYGRYSGVKDGYLLLSENGTGEYVYDINISTEACEDGIIKFEWGFLIDENNNVVHFNRSYGLSYPVIYKCTAKPWFQSCRKEFMVDYILEKNNILVVSSSDDWTKSFD